MASYKNFSKKNRAEKDGKVFDLDSPLSYDPIKEQDVNYEGWAEFLSYYRYYPDKFACEILGVNLYPFQKLLFRAMAHHKDSVLIACRGLTKSWIIAMFSITMAILYPTIKIGITSGTGGQARKVVTDKIEDDLMRNYENIRREIEGKVISSKDDCYVKFKNGSQISAFALNQGAKGDSTRGKRFQIIIIDEARIVKDDITEEVLIPMTNVPRQNVIRENNLRLKTNTPLVIENAKSIFLSSAYLKSCNLYQRFLQHYYKMLEGNKNYFVCSLDYKVGVPYGILNEETILSQLEKPTMTIDIFNYEYRGVFVGSSSDSYFPYETTQNCRVLENCEMEQPKNSNERYILTQDVAVSGSKDSDNAVIHIIKLKPKSNGTFIKEVVYTKVMNGWKLQDQRDFVRELVHIKFPNIEKILIDGINIGAGYIALFAETWSYRDNKGNIIDFPPLVRDDDVDNLRLKGSIDMIKSMEAYGNFNNDAFNYTKSCFENNSIRLLTHSTESDEKYKDGIITSEEQAQHIEHDILQQELANICEVISENTGKKIFGRKVKRKKRDRATSLVYGLYYVMLLELDEKIKLENNDDDDLFAYLGFY